jgi:site-specific recombinase XerD
MKLSQAIQEFDLSMVDIKADSTRRVYMYTLRQVLEQLGDVELDTITISQLRQCRSVINRPKLSQHTKHRNVRQTRTFFKWCTTEGFLPQSPAARLEMPRLPKDELPKDVDPKDMDRLLHTAYNTGGIRDYALVRFLAESGCRVGGLVKLTPANLDLDNCTAEVCEKGTKFRTVRYGKETAKALRVWLLERPLYQTGGPKRHQVDRPDDKLFLGQRGNLSVSGVYRLLERLAKKGNVQGRFNPHGFRHGLARRLLKNRADMGTVSQLLGHEDIETTHHFYARWLPDELTGRFNEFGGPLE